MLELGRGHVYDRICHKFSPCAQLQIQFVDLGGARCADGMAFRLETPARVDRQGPFQRSSSALNILAPLPWPAESKVLVTYDLSYGEAVVEFRDINVSGSDICH